MPKILNPVNFHPYGEILRRKKWDEIKKTLIPYLYSKQELFDSLFVNDSSETVLDAVGVIVYIGTSSDSLDAFWLDQIICLKKGVFFGFLTEPPSSITVYSHSKPNRSTEKIDPLPGILPSFSLDEIITVSYQEKEENFSFEGERHTFWEFTYIDSGTLATTCDEQNLLAEKGQYLLYPPGQYHTQRTFNGAPVSFLTITFRCKDPFLNKLTQRVYNISKDAAAVLEKIIRELRMPDNYTNDLLFCYIKELIVLLYRQSAQTKKPQIDTRQKRLSDNSIIHQVQVYIDAHLYERLTVRQLADVIPISPGYLSVLFKKKEHVTLIEYINLKKAKLAAVLLQSGKYTVSEVAFQLSFSSVHYFSKVFKKMIGLSPGEYAKTFKE